jgi:hypothetical protein
MWQKPIFTEGLAGASGNCGRRLPAAIVAKAQLSPRHCERSEAIQTAIKETVWIASSLRSSQ